MTDEMREIVDACDKHLDICPICGNLTIPDVCPEGQILLNKFYDILREEGLRDVPKKRD